MVSDVVNCNWQYHTGYAAIENALNNRRTRIKIDRDGVFDCRQSGEKWQLEIMFLTIFDLRSSIVTSVIDCRISGVNERANNFGCRVLDSVCGFIKLTIRFFSSY